MSAQATLIEAINLLQEEPVSPVTPPLAVRLTQKRRRLRPTTVLKGISYATVCLSILALVGIVAFVLIRGIPNLSWHFVFGKYSARDVTISGVLVTTFKVVFVSILLATPIGVGCAIYLVEYTGRGNKLVKIIKVATETLAGIPSIVFGLFGMIFFVDALKMGRSVFAGSLTLALMILPTIISTVEESLRAVPDPLREGSFGLGASKLRTVFCIVLPSALSGILSAVILGMGRVVSESACVMFTSGTEMRMGKSFNAEGATLAVAMYKLASEGDANEAFAIGVVLIVLVVALNLLATLVANKLRRDKPEKAKRKPKTVLVTAKQKG